MKCRPRNQHERSTSKGTVSAGLVAVAVADRRVLVSIRCCVSSERQKVRITKCADRHAPRGQSALRGDDGTDAASGIGQSNGLREKRVSANDGETTAYSTAYVCGEVGKESAG